MISFCSSYINFPLKVIVALLFTAICSLPTFHQQTQKIQSLDVNVPQIEGNEMLKDFPRKIDTQTTLDVHGAFNTNHKIKRDISSDSTSKPTAVKPQNIKRKLKQKKKISSFHFRC